MGRPLMSVSDPWRALGRTLDQCRSACDRADYVMLVARHSGEPCGFALLHPRGVAGSPYLASLGVAAAWRSGA